MLITRPNCTAGFEIPTELIGRKGRSLKCATCGHSWFQSAVVEEIELADVMAENKAAEVSKDMGGPQGGPNVSEAATHTQAVAAAANVAMEQDITSSEVAQVPPPKDNPVEAVSPLEQGANQGAPPPRDIPVGATSMLSKSRDVDQ